MNQSSYCSIHNTHPVSGEPCWQCVNQAERAGAQDMKQRILDRAEEMSEWSIFPTSDNTVSRALAEQIVNDAVAEIITRIKETE